MEVFTKLCHSDYDDENNSGYHVNSVNIDENDSEIPEHSFNNIFDSENSVNTFETDNHDDYSSNQSSKVIYLTYSVSKIININSILHILSNRT